MNNLKELKREREGDRQTGRQKDKKTEADRQTEKWRDCLEVKGAMKKRPNGRRK